MMWNRKRNGRRGKRQADSCLNPAIGGNGQICSLNTVGCGCRCRIHCNHAHGAVRQRLLDMGFLPDAEVEVLRVATLGDPIEIRLGDSCVTLRKREAAQIEINPN